MLGAAIQKVLPATRWRPAFEATGILGQQSRVSASLLRNLSLLDPCSDRAGRRTRRCSCCSGVSKRDASGYQFVCIMAATKCKTKKTSRRGSPATTTGATSASKAVATHIPTDTSNTGLTLCLATWQDRVQVDDFNCVFWAGKRGRRKEQVGRVPDTSNLCLGSKLFGIKSQSGSALICSRSMLFRCGLAHDTIIFNIVHDS